MNGQEDRPDLQQVEAAVAAVLAGDTERYAEIVERFQGDVLAISSAMLGRQDEVEEMAQRAFVAAYRHLDSYQPGTRFDHWLKAIARNVVRMEVRKRATRQRHLAAYREDVLARYSVCDDSDAYEQDLRDALRECRSELPDHGREMLTMRYEGGMSFSDIARRTGRTAQAVQRAVSRFRMALRDCISTRMGTA